MSENRHAGVCPHGTSMLQLCTKCQAPSSFAEASGSGTVNAPRLLTKLKDLNRRIAAGELDITGQCECCASPLGERVLMEHTTRMICDRCLGFITRWLIELESPNSD
jgi:hypothetical protein